MRTLILFSFFFMVASANLWDDIKDFGKFVAAKAGEYYDEAEKFVREKIFNENIKMVEEHNKLYKEGKSSYELKINEYSDMRLSEFKDKSTGLRKFSGEVNLQEYNISETNHGLQSDPTVDWRTRGFVTNVKTQGMCNACWAFGVAAAIETHYGRKTGKLVSLSPQYLIDCAKEFHNKGCGGGYQEYAYAYIAKYGGIALADDYKYTGKNSNCKHDPSENFVTIKGFTTIPAKDENRMKEIITNFGPLTCSVSVNEEFLLYAGGIFDDADCASNEVTHTVTVIGYGKDHWIIKNSWGHSWGENGYMRLGFNNICNIAAECSYPVL